MSEPEVRARETKTPWYRFWRQDALASLVVFLVALPLCMGIALASGAPIATGLVTGIIGGLVVGFLAGSPLQVSGPAAGLTVVCGEVIRQHGVPALGIVVLIAGVQVHPVVSILGFVLMLVSAIVGVNSWQRVAGEDDKGESQSAPHDGSGPKPSNQDFMEKLEERWRRRQDGGDN